MTSISANGSTEILSLQQSGSNIQYKRNSGAWTTIVSWPLTINNTNPTTKLKILLETDIRLTSTSHYFIFDNVLNVGPIQFGDTKLTADGQRKVIQIDSVTSYGGLIQNGTNSIAGKSNITVCNLVVNGTTSTLDAQAGWFGRVRYGIDARANFFINCHSDGAIGFAAGGIIGDFGGYNKTAVSTSLTLIRCTSSGDIDSNAGGIMATYAGQGSGANVLVTQCYSSGTINTNSGGIIGGQAAYGGGSVTVLKCYSLGDFLGSGAGGIFGPIAGNQDGSTEANTCYSLGSMTGQIGCGGIFGSLAGPGTTSAVATNCYTIGAIDSNLSCGGIFGQSYTNALAQNCYATGSTTASTGYIYSGSTTVPSGCYSEAKFGTSGWNDVHAKLALSGYPTSSVVGNSWTNVGTNIRYEISYFGYTPYQQEIIADNSLIQTYSQTFPPGGSTVAALAADASGNVFQILEISGGKASSYGRITINVQTGKITTQIDMELGTYNLKVSSVGSYFTTTVILNIELSGSLSGGADCCVTGAALKGNSYEQINQYRIGNALVSEHTQNTQMRFSDYSEYVKYKMSQGSAKF